MANTSPRSMGSNMLNNLVESHVGSSRGAIKSDLLGKVVYDDPAVFKRLRVDQVDNDFVARCLASFNAANSGDIGTLLKFSDKASKKTPEQLEKEENQDKADDTKKEETSGNHGSPEEKKMYDPLVRMFSYIAEFDQANTRKFQKTNCMLKADEPHTFGFPSCSPDLIISPHGIDASKSKLWRDRDAFGEVKPSNKQGPKPATPGTIPPIVIQSADYARLFMSSRPFMLFCVGILVFGTGFCVGIYDRDGITFSPIFDMFKDTSTFIRVVRTLGCNLSVEELGFDPTVRALTDEETRRLTGKTEYPSAVVSSCGNDSRQWCTIGPPIWSSLSLLGRGTNVWRVREYVAEDPHKRLGGKEMILKTAWRSSARTSESDIYMSIDQPPEGLAKFECGGDVSSAGYPITVRNLRGQAVDALDIDSPTPVLHRLVLSTVGRPLWEYTSDLDLLTGFRAALEAHKALCDRGILHRDISPGNVMLTEVQNGSLRGFIADLEFARVESPTISKPERTVTLINVGAQNKYDDRGHVHSRTEPTTRTHIRFQSTVTVKRGAGMTGTAQFMARKILLQSVLKPAGQIVHEATHDVESFIWVLCYSVMRNLFHRAFRRNMSKEIRDQRNAFRNLFCQAFSQTTAESIAGERQSGSRCLIFPAIGRVNEITSSFMSKALIFLFEDLRDLIHLASARNPTPLTHDALLKVIEDAINSLQDH